MKDSEQTLWYGSCSYWTDDWDKLRVEDAKLPNGKIIKRGGVPLCPVCGAPGFIAGVDKWMAQAERFEDEGNPRYVEFLNGNKERCLPMGLLTAYKTWVASQLPK